MGAKQQMDENVLKYVEEFLLDIFNYNINGIHKNAYKFCKSFLLSDDECEMVINNAEARFKTKTIHNISVSTLNREDTIEKVVFQFLKFKSQSIDKDDFGLLAFYTLKLNEDITIYVDLNSSVVNGKLDHYKADVYFKVNK